MKRALEEQFVPQQRFRSAALTLIVVNVIIYVVQLILGDRFTNAFLLNSSEVWARPWILITSMFLHADPTHLIFNMYALLVFGPLIEQKIGTRRFVFIYFLSGILASVISTFFYERALGASGAIMGILGVTIMLLPHLQVLFFFFIPMSLRTAGIIFAAIDIFGIFVPSGIANIAHIVGLGTGLLYGWHLLRKKREFTKRFVEKSPKKKKADALMLSNEDIEDYLKHGRL
ncbi:MAG: rhomboid family intramembrane serine protease [Nanoarchaeota archaeon]